MHAQQRAYAVTIGNGMAEQQKIVAIIYLPGYISDTVH
jgi:hypothetical protein